MAVSFWGLVKHAWDWLLTLILPQNIDGQCQNHTKINLNDTPSAVDFIENLEPFQIVLLSVGTALTLAILLIASIQWWYIFNYVSSEQRRNKLYLLISLFPVCSWCCLVGMFCPRTALLVSSFGLLYFLLCLFVLVSLMRHLAGGRAALSYSLGEKRKMIDFRSPPFCCLLCCLPQARPSIVNLTRLEWIVLQAPIIRVLIVFGQVVVVAEARENAYKWLQFFDLATLASLLLAIFGIHTLARVTSEELSRFGFGGIFRLVDLGLLFFSAQQPFIFQNILLRFGIIHCGVLLSPQANARSFRIYSILNNRANQKMYSTNVGDRPPQARYNTTTGVPHQQQNGGGGERVIRSEVWNCFDLDGLMAICRACNERLKVGPTRQTSSLWRHLKRHSHEVQSRLLRSSRVANSHKLAAVMAMGGGMGGGSIQRRGGGNNDYAHLLPSAVAESDDGGGGMVGPMVTVDCKAVESLELDQLLGFRQRDGQDEAMLENGGAGVEMGIGDPDEVTELLLEGEEATNNETGRGRGGAAGGIMAQNHFETVLVEFLLENALPFGRLLHQSPSLGHLLRLFSPNPAGLQRSLPSAGSLLSQIVPKMFKRTLDERKAQFEEDFFVLVLRRTRVESTPKGTWILRVSAVKLGDGFGLCSRCLGIFSFRAGLGRMRDALQRCFELGRVQLNLWQVSAVVHDGNADFVELCRQLDLPGIPSSHSLLRNIYAELDKLEFSADCVRRVKGRFERAIGDSLLDGMHFSAFSIAVPSLITRIDEFFRQEQSKREQKEAAEDGGTAKSAAEWQLLDKFRTLWTFQRERLLADSVARMSIFLNPSARNDAGNGSPFDAEQWAQIEANVVEEICQACLPNTGEMTENELFERRSDIEAEVNNFVDTAICEFRRRTPPPMSNGAMNNGGTDNGSMDNPTAGVHQQRQQSLSELLLWWRLNLERFPRVGHLARQFCAIPLGIAEMGDDWKKHGDDCYSSQDMREDLKNAVYAAELLAKDLDADEEAMGTLSQLLTVRMAVVEKNRCALPD